LVQGLTEFLPVSSSGHLVLAQEYLGIGAPGIVVEVTLHVATALAVVVYFRRRLKTTFWGAAGGKGGWLRFVALLVVASVPAAVVGLVFENDIEPLFESRGAVGVALLFTAAVLLSSSSLRRRDAKLTELGFAAALAVGAAQALAVAPGISRSGMTIVAGLLVGLRGAGGYENRRLPRELGGAGARLRRRFRRGVSGDIRRLKIVTRPRVRVVRRLLRRPRPGGPLNNVNKSPNVRG
jgi:undecaprenyl-diphosphatase UppP